MTRRRTDGPTDRPGYRDARMNKRVLGSFSFFLPLLKEPMKLSPYVSETKTKMNSGNGRRINEQRLAVETIEPRANQWPNQIECEAIDSFSKRTMSLCFSPKLRTIQGQSRANFKNVNDTNIEKCYTSAST